MAAYSVTFSPAGPVKTYLSPTFYPGLNYWQSVRQDYETDLKEETITPEREKTYKSLLSMEGIEYTTVREPNNKIGLSISNDELEKIPPQLESRLCQSLGKYEDSANWNLNWMMNLRIEHMQEIFTDFKDQLRICLPDLADKNFGFTINEHGLLEVTSPEGALTDKETNQLNGWLNDLDDLKELTFEHAKLVIHSLNHVPELTRYEGLVTLKNIYAFIDYGLLLQNGGTSPARGFSWVEQLQVKAEKILEQQQAENKPEK